MINDNIVLTEPKNKNKIKMNNEWNKILGNDFIKNTSSKILKSREFTLRTKMISYFRFADLHEINIFAANSFLNKSHFVAHFNSK